MPELTAHHSWEDIIKTSGFCFLFCLNELKALQQKSISSNRESLNLSCLVQRREYVHGPKNLVLFESNLQTIPCSQAQPFGTIYLKGKTLFPTAHYLLHVSSVIPTLAAWSTFPLHPLERGTPLCCSLSLSEFVLESTQGELSAQREDLEFVHLPLIASVLVAGTAGQTLMGGYALLPLALTHYFRQLHNRPASSACPGRSASWTITTGSPGPLSRAGESN